MKCPTCEGKMPVRVINHNHLLEKDTIVEGTGDKIGTDDLNWNDRLFLAPNPKNNICYKCGEEKKRFVLYCPEGTNDLLSFKSTCLDCFRLIMLE